MLPNVGMGELLLILVVILLLFGTKRLPDVAKGLGRSVRAFKEGLREGLEEEPTAVRTPEAAKSDISRDNNKNFPA